MTAAARIGQHIRQVGRIDVRVPDPVQAPRPGNHFALASGNEVGEHVAAALGL